jgi:hypothetical protein
MNRRSDLVATAVAVVFTGCSRTPKYDVVIRNGLLYDGRIRAEGERHPIAAEDIAYIVKSILEMDRSRIRA